MKNIALVENFSVNTRPGAAEAVVQLFDNRRGLVLKGADGSTKADWGVGIALDIYEAAPGCDTIVLVSGDGDFTILLERIRKRFKTRTVVYGVPKLTANPLIMEAHQFNPIDSNLLLR